MWPGSSVGRRPGFTVLELLVAASLTTLLAGLAVQGTFEYFRLKQGLLLRTELRHAVEAVQARLSSKLQQAIDVMSLPGGGYVLVLAQDRDRCGYVCFLDRYEVLRWEVVPEPGRTGTTFLREVRITTRAFRLPVSEGQLQPLFAKAVGKSERVASGVTTLLLEPEGDRFYNAVVRMQREGPSGSAPVEMAHQQFVALRPRPHQEHLPDIAALGSIKGADHDAFASPLPSPTAPTLQVPSTPPGKAPPTRTPAVASSPAPAGGGAP